MKRIIFLLLIAYSLTFAQVLTKALPAAVGIDEHHLKMVDKVINEAVTKEEIPGAVLTIVKDNFIVYEKAYGYKQLLPKKLKMELTTQFDLASLTKPIATATSAMILLEQGKLRLLDIVEDFFPVFKTGREDSSSFKEPIRLIHLLTHTSGLPDYAKVEKVKKMYDSPAPDSLLAYIGRMKRHHETGTYFKYSCLNFITLQKIIEKISGQNFRNFSENNIFMPLNMKNTVFLPKKSTNCAPTEILAEGMLHCTVHDPLARVMMGGISGNAGLFSTTQDLVIFATMMLNNGQYNGKRILGPASVKAMTSLVPGFEKFGRGLGWDLNSAYSSNQGDLFSDKTYGHTGYTGTSFIIDPQKNIAVIFLTNRVHPDDGGKVVRLRSLVANIIAASIK